MKYKRLQVGPVWLRTLIEIALILLAFVVCSSMVVSYYEDAYYESTQAQAAESNAQLAYSLALSVDLDLLGIEDKERSDYAREHYYEPLLNNCFISGDVLNSGAVYAVTDGKAQLFASSDHFPTELPDDYSAALEKSISQGDVSFKSDRTDITLVPIEDDLGNVRAVLAVCSEYRDSMDYNSIVNTRMTTIAIVCGGIIVIYYIVSGILTSKNKRKGAQVE